MVESLLLKAAGYRDSWRRLSPNTRGVIWVLVGCVLWSIIDGLVKATGRGDISPFQIAFIRYSVGFILLIPIAMRGGWSGLKTSRPGIHAGRIAIALTGQVLAYFAVINMILADVTAINFTRPLFVTVLAVFLLGELVSRKRWIATAVGFIGTLIVVRPGHSAFDPVSLVAITSAVLFSFALVMIRIMARTEPPPRILFYYHLGSAVLCAVPAAIVWQQPTLAQWGLLVAIGVITTLAMWCFVSGFSLAESSVVGPIEYTRLIFATAIGFFVFAEIPSIWTIIGAIIIVGAALVIAQESAGKKKTDGTKPSPNP